MTRPSNRRRAAPARGFTLLELLIVITIIAMASAVASLALRDPAATRLEREGQRLILLLESGRAQSRALGIPITWMPASALTQGQAGVGGRSNDLGAQGAAADFRFVGAPDLGSDGALPSRFLEAQTEDSRVTIELTNRPNGIMLGPEPLIDPQRIVLRLKDHRFILVTDGLGPFVAVSE